MFSPLIGVGGFNSNMRAYLSRSRENVLLDRFSSNFYSAAGTDNELIVPEMQKKLGVTVFVSEIRRVEN